MKRITLLIFLMLLLQPQTPFGQTREESYPEECYLSRKLDPPVDLADQLEEAILGNCRAIRLEAGEWEVLRRIAMERHQGPLQIRGSAGPTILKSRVSPMWVLERVNDFRVENLTVEGSIELKETENVVFRSVRFLKGGIVFAGNRCNQPNECTSYHRNALIENCVFEDSPHGILAERLEDSRIVGNQFTGPRLSSGCARENVGIELDGSTEDLDRPLEQGHSKGNLILQNTFDQEFAIGIRVRESRGNILRENQFRRSYRSFEFLEGARHNQVISNYIGYLSQQPVTSACPAPCGIYTGPGSVNNIFLNNFFEQNFEIQFLESNRNKTFIIDESGNLNIFRSDFLGIRQ